MINFKSILIKDKIKLYKLMIYQPQNRQPSQFSFRQIPPHQQKTLQKNQLLDQINKNNNFYQNKSMIEQSNQQSQKLQKIDNKQVKIDKKQIAQLQKAYQYIRKYQPLYFNNVEMKQLIYKYKKGVQIKKYKQGYYFGQISTNQYDKCTLKHGKGIFIYGLFTKSNSTLAKVYQGEWADDKRHGMGYQRFPDSSVFHGYYYQGKPQGKGKLTSPTGQIYEGQWQQGIKHGQAYWKGPTGQVYTGQWNAGKPQGFGVFTNQKGDKYQGDFKNSLKHGSGIQRFRNGDIYKGLYQNGKPHGSGQYYWSNKSYFKGHFKNGLRCGKGFWKRSAGNCDQYDGQYQNDKKWGYGVFTWATGNLYKGQYWADHRHGYGEMYWTEGNWYKGDWKDGLQSGQGQLFIKNQGLRKGTFQNNQIIEVLYEQLYDFQNEQNGNQMPTNSIKQNKLIKSLSKSSRLQFNQGNLVVSKISKTTKHHFQASKNILKTKSSRFTLLQQKNNSTHQIKYQNRIKSVPLKQLFYKTNTTKQSRYQQFQNKDKEFRINKARPFSQEKGHVNMSFQVKESTIRQKKMDRILHSSFYIHRFKNIGKTTSTNFKNDFSNLSIK